MGENRLYPIIIPAIVEKNAACRYTLLFVTFRVMPKAIMESNNRQRSYSYIERIMPITERMNTIMDIMSNTLFLIIFQKLSSIIISQIWKKLYFDDLFFFADEILDQFFVDVFDDVGI